jgi:hypothetical protein
MGKKMVEQAFCWFRLYWGQNCPRDLPESSLGLNKTLSRERGYEMNLWRNSNEPDPFPTDSTTASNNFCQPGPHAHSTTPIRSTVHQQRY